MPLTKCAQLACYRTLKLWLPGQDPVARTRLTLWKHVTHEHQHSFLMLVFKSQMLQLIRILLHVNSRHVFFLFLCGSSQLRRLELVKRMSTTIQNAQ